MRPRPPAAVTAAASLPPAADGRRAQDAGPPSPQPPVCRRRPIPSAPAGQDARSPDDRSGGCGEPCAQIAKDTRALFLIEAEIVDVHAPILVRPWRLVALESRVGSADDLLLIAHADVRNGRDLHMHRHALNGNAAMRSTVGKVYALARFRPK